MNDYTVVFDHPHEHTPEYVHISTIDTRHVHLMFFGTLANEWEYGWEEMRLMYGKVIPGLKQFR